MQGNYVSTNNVLVKITRRRKKNSTDSFVYHSHEVLGVATSTVRFREMADYQHYVEDSKVLSMMAALKGMDVAAFEESFTDYHDNWPLLGPPLFSRAVVPLRFGYSAAARDQEEQSEATVVKYNPENVDVDAEHVPDALPERLKGLVDLVPVHVKDKMRTLFDGRSVWTRSQLLTNFEEKDAIHVKKALPLYSYIFSKGVFRNCWVKYGYDPRKHKESKYYQSIDLRNFDINKGKNSNKDTEAIKLFSGNPHLGGSILQPVDFKDGPMRDILYFNHREREVWDVKDGFFAKIHMEVIRKALIEYTRSFATIDRVEFVTRWTNYIQENDNGDEELSQMEKLKTAKGKSRERLLEQQVEDLMGAIMPDLPGSDNSDYEIFGLNDD